MEEVKDTLWQWFVQLSALAGVGGSTLLTIEMTRDLFRTYDNASLAGVLALIAFTILCGLALGALWLQLLRMKRWAGWSIQPAALLFAAFVDFVAQKQNEHNVPMVAATFVYMALLFYALVFKKRIWRAES